MPPFVTQSVKTFSWLWMSSARFSQISSRVSIVLTVFIPQQGQKGGGASHCQLQISARSATVFLEAFVAKVFVGGLYGLPFCDVASIWSSCDDAEMLCWQLLMSFRIAAEKAGSSLSASGERRFGRLWRRVIHFFVLSKRKTKVNAVSLATFQFFVCKSWTIFLARGPNFPFDEQKRSVACRTV